MDFLKLIWKYRLIPLLLIGGGYIWYASEESAKTNAELEKKIAAEAEEKKKNEQKMFEKYNAAKNPAKCNITYDVKFETYGEDVSVELRVGEVGNSFPLVIKQAKDSQISYTGLCPNKYFLAIGNDKNVSTTPVKDFSSNSRYNSTVQLTKGVGNMGSSRREKL